MVRALVYTKRARARRRWTERRNAPICRSCATTPEAGSADARVSALRRGDPEGEAAPCAACGLPVILEPDPRRKVATCSDLCRSRVYSAAATQRRVAESVTRSCEGCGRGMEGRSDRRYCTPACRQRAYRARVGAHGTAGGGQAQPARSADDE